MVRPQAEAKGLSFTIRHEGELPTWIKADAKRLRQILVNLLSNAVRFTESGEVMLRLDFRQQVARIDIVDTGIGIAVQDQKRIFLPYERGSAGRRVAEAGTGLGLTITHLLTDMMGGELTMQSQPGLGTTFSLRLYLPVVIPESTEILPGDNDLSTVIGYEGPRKTLLVVDDEPLHRQLLASLLMPLGFVVTEAASGLECLEVIQHHPPDLLLLDITMDGLDGWETASAVRRLRPAAEMPLLFVSANLLDNEPERLAALACQGFVGKPVVESELFELLKDAMNLKWVRAPFRSESATPVATSKVGTHPLPEELREDLMRLARQGQASALRQRLKQSLDEFPDHGNTLATLLACSDRFDFQTLISLLNPSTGTTDDDTDL